MKKFILLRLFLFIISAFFLITCFNNTNNNISIATITLIDIQCEKCYEEIYSIIKGNKGIHDFEIFQSKDQSTILINIRYNYKNVDINAIKLSLANNGFVIDGTKQ